jgi:hypothetical protein
MNRQLRARVLLEEARALELDLDDLVAAATGEARPVTVAAWIDEIAPTFGPSTAATYRPYWRLAARLIGDRRLAELTTTDLAAVVDAAAERARSHRVDSTGRASRETCIAALRALYPRAVDAGHVTRQSSCRASQAAAHVESTARTRRSRADRPRRRRPSDQHRPRPRPAPRSLPPRDRRSPPRRPQPPAPRHRPRSLHRVAPREERHRTRTTRLTVVGRARARSCARPRR